MAKYTKAQVDTAITTILDNASGLVTPAIVRAVLATLRDMEQLASYIKFTNATLQATTVEEALAAIAHANIPVWSSELTYDAGYTVYWQYLLYVANVNITAGGAEPGASNNWILVSGGEGGTMTAGQIKASLETLTLTDRLNASAIQGLITDADQLTYDDPAFGFIGSALNFLVLRQNMDYSQTMTYKVGYVVFYSGKLYRCKITCVNIPPTNTNYWQVAIPNFTSSADFVAIHEDAQKTTDFVITTGDTVTFEERCLLFTQAITYKWEIQNEAYGSPIVYSYKRAFDYVFTLAGTYKITLSALDSSGSVIDSELKTGFVEVEDPVQNFTIYYGTSADNIVLEAEAVLGTAFIDTTPTETLINFNMQSNAYPWMVAPASHVYTLCRDESLGGWFDITQVYSVSNIYIGGILHKLYMYKFPTLIIAMSFKTI